MKLKIPGTGSSDFKNGIFRISKMQFHRRDPNSNGGSKSKNRTSKVQFSNVDQDQLDLQNRKKQDLVFHF